MVEQKTDVQLTKVVELCLLSGELMLKSGAETARVEDTMSRIASSFGIHDSQSYVTPTAILFSLNREEPAKLVRIDERSTDLEKVAIVNNISRKISSGELSLEAALKEMKETATINHMYSNLVQVMTATIVSGCFLIMFEGKWNDFLPACIAGGIGFAFFIYVHKILKLKFFSEFISSFMIGLTSFLFVKFGLGLEIGKIMIGSVMPLVPGLLITNAVRDLMTGHFVSAVSKGAEAFLTSLAIGSGIAIVFALY